jgi:hypothetical protein
LPIERSVSVMPNLQSSDILSFTHFATRHALRS